MILHPPDEPALCDAVRAETRVLPFAGRTKPALSPSEGVTLLDLRAFSGIVEYEPTEYTFTARAATPTSLLGMRSAAVRVPFPSWP